MNGFIDHLCTSLATTINYSAIANLHNKSSLACRVSNIRSLATTSNSGDSSASRAQVLSSQPSVQNSLSAVNSAITPSLLSNSTVVFTFVAAGTCLQIPCLGTGYITPLFIRYCIATAIYATILSRVYGSVTNNNRFLDWIIGFNDHLQVITTNNYNIC
jgi:hypothetical protein